jgi:hypothetical protein
MCGCAAGGRAGLDAEEGAIGLREDVAFAPEGTCDTIFINIDGHAGVFLEN